MKKSNRTKLLTSYVSGLWIGDKLPPLAELCIRTYLSRGIGFQFFTYQDYPNVPEGTIVRDGSEIIPKECIFRHVTGSYAPFSDWFRYTLLEREGGFWTDMDVVFIGDSLPKNLPWFALQEPGMAAIGIIGFPAQHPVMTMLRERAENPSAPMPWDEPWVLDAKKKIGKQYTDAVESRKLAEWGTSGPEAFTLVLNHYGLLGQAADPSTIYPLHYTVWRYCYNGDVRLGSERLKGAWAVHLWGEMLRREPDALENLHPESIVGQLMHELMPHAMVKQETKILVGICSAQGYEGRRNAVRNTWLKHKKKGVTCIFFLGGKVPADEMDDTVGLDVPDSYNALPGKVLEFFKYALKHYEFDWLFKCDDDTYLDTSRLPDLLDEQYGLIGDLSLNERNTPSGGAGYLLSREIVEKIVRVNNIPLEGAEDVIFGQLALDVGAKTYATPRLYMSNEWGPLPDNNMVTSHWCSPLIMEAMETLRFGRPFACFHGKHQHWEDDLLFFESGVFRRKKDGSFGWWELDQYGILSLKWKSWMPEQLVWRDDRFAGSSMELKCAEDSPDLWGQRTKKESCPEWIHLSRKPRYLDGWMNQDLSQLSHLELVPWKDGSVRGYYLDHLIEYLELEQFHCLLKEIKRTLVPGGFLRIAWGDIVQLQKRITPGLLQIVKQHHSHQGNDGVLADALVGMEHFRSFWTLDALSAFLEFSGFSTQVCLPGESSHAMFRDIEEKNTDARKLTHYLGLLCLEAKV